MKILKTSDITDTASMPIKARTIDFIQEAHKENTTAVVESMLGYAADPTIGYKLLGVDASIVGATWTVTTGYIYFNGEMFKVNASSFTVGAGEQAYGIISDVPYPAADPVLFGDDILRTVHLNRQVTFTNAISGDFLYSNTRTSTPWLRGDVKEIDCDAAYIAANFVAAGPTLGLGIGERSGWAICNGNNGTKNRNGRVPVQYNGGSFVMGQTGGEETHLLTKPEMPIHSHTINGDVNENHDFGPYVIGGGTNLDRIPNTNTEGGDQPHNNMQPYLVTLFVQKI